ncbi:MAG: hypothetical protein ACWGQW_01915 [bacterium]
MFQNIATQAKDRAINDLLIRKAVDTVIVKNAIGYYVIWTRCMNHEKDYIGPDTYGQYRTLKRAQEIQRKFKLSGPKISYSMDWDRMEIVPTRSLGK